ncbi:fatty acid alpha-hydroxylase [Maublancomyces gigas]|uniref:Ceramide very long chain fatty acid hydroxylase n=1 Tax=Discina gigas TaxID=1032678 RepID=A0ABR3GX51_9PEZI
MSYSSLPIISATEVEKHQSSHSCYVTIGNKVYDITSFLGDHPGGEDLILDYAARDITAVLADKISHAHSESAYEILEDYLIGFLPTDAARMPPSPPSTPLPGSTPRPGSPVGPSSLTGMSSEEELTIPTDINTDFRTHKFIDLNQPMLPQVWNGGFSKKFYLEQIHRPRHYKGGESAPLFGNFLEPLTKTPWYIVPVIWLPCVSYGTWIAYSGLQNWVLVVALFFHGLLWWTLVEYVLHRCLFHIDKIMPEGRLSITLHFLLHGIHHFVPMDKLRLVMPPSLFFFLAIPFWYLAHTIFWFNWYVATNVYFGGVFGYVCYDLTHYFLHHKSLPSYFRELKKYHLQHHFADFQKGFGVTSKLWDRVFGTELIYGGPESFKDE